MRQIKSRKNDGIQILRALCAIQVFFSHTLNVYQSSLGSKIINTPLHFFFDGQCAVIIFFVLSGFLYYNDKKLTLKLYIKKILSKSLHIFPSYWISLIIGSIMCNLYLENNITGESSNLTEWINSFWKQNISFTDFMKAIIVFPLNNTDLINPPSWYLLVEIKMFIIMPLLIYFFNKCSWKYAYIFIFISMLLPSQFLFTIIGAFTLGACLHKYIKQHNFPNSTLKNTLLTIFLGIILLNIKNEINTQNSILPITIIQSIGAVFIIFQFYNISINSNKWFNKFLIFLGNISYEIYIFHFVILLILIPLIKKDTILLVTLTFILTTLLSYLLHHINNYISQKIIYKFNQKYYTYTE